MTTEQSSENRQYITFVANKQEFAANIMAIREIRGWTDTTPLPHVPDYVRGVINLRGTVLPVIDLKSRLGLGMNDATAKHVIIVVNTGTRATGILVDAVSDIITLTSAQVQPPPDVMQESQDKYVNGIAVLEGRMVTLLEMDNLISAIQINYSGTAEPLQVN